MRIPLKIIPQEIIDTYDLTELVDNRGWIYMCIKRGVYGLKQAGIITNQELLKHMAQFGYHPVQHTPSLWSCSNPRWDNLPSGHQLNPLLGLILWYLYWVQNTLLNKL